MMDKMLHMTPKVGMGVTEHIGSDSYAGTITRVSKSEKTFWFTGDKYKAVGGDKQTRVKVLECGQDEDGRWFYEVIPTEFQVAFPREVPQEKLKML